jgi:hypothetical protein
MTRQEVYKSLKNIDPILLKWIKGRYDDEGDDSFEEDIEEGIIICDLDACLEFIQSNGYKDMMHGGTEQDEDKAMQFLMKHLKEKVPTDFPYNIITEDGNDLWNKQ